ncbi:MAG: competence type IV pilus major pilin ComGC [Acidobacteriota bacterium]
MTDPLVARDKGFTLVELMVVLVIIGILVSIAVPVYQATAENAEATTCRDNLRLIDGALVQWHVADIQNHTWDKINTVGDLVTAGYLKAAPVEPSNGHYSIPLDGGVRVAKCDKGHTYP